MSLYRKLRQVSSVFGQGNRVDYQTRKRLRRMSDLQLSGTLPPSKKRLIICRETTRSRRAAAPIKRFGGGADKSFCGLPREGIIMRSCPE
jgi:hypothetical protein